MFTSFRSHLVPFLKFIQSNFEVVVWSAGEAQYVYDRLTYCGIVSYVDYVLSREHCSVIGGNYIKNLNKLGRNLQNVVLLDDNFDSCLLNVQNCIPVKKFQGYDDEELLQQVVLLRKLLQYQTLVKGIEVQIFSQK